MNTIGYSEPDTLPSISIFIPNDPNEDIIVTLGDGSKLAPLATYLSEYRDALLALLRDGTNL